MKKAIHSYGSLLIAAMQLIACHPRHEGQPVFQWKQYAVLPSSNGRASLGYAGPAVGIHQNLLLIGGGANFPNGMPWAGGRKEYYSEAYITGIETDPPTLRKISLPYKVAYSANCSTPAGIVCAGGEAGDGPLNFVLLVRFDQSRPVIAFLPALPLELTNAAAAAIGNDVYIAGGESRTAVSARFFKLNLKDTSKGWQPLRDIPHPVSHTVLVAMPEKGKIFLAGGRKKTQGGVSDLYRNVFEYDLVTNHWTEKRRLPYALSAGTGAMIGDRYMALFGGDKGVAFHKTEALIAAISKEQDPVKQQVLKEEKNRVQIAHPGFSNEILLYDVENDLWTLAGKSSFSIPVTTTAVTKDHRIWIPSGEIKAGVRTPVILEVTIK